MMQRGEASRKRASSSGWKRSKTFATKWKMFWTSGTPEIADNRWRGRPRLQLFHVSISKGLLCIETIAKKIKELDSRLDQIMKDKDVYNFVACDQESKRVSTTTSFVDATEIQGRDIDASNVIRELMENAREKEEKGPLVISIVGVGGIGKTTLAQLVYGDQQIKARFDERVWVCVSDPFDQIKIAKAIIESTTQSSTDLSQLQVLLEKIQSTLSQKRFLLVLDDVWTEQYSKWEPLKNSLKVGLPGSRILVTSRSERVASFVLEMNVIVLTVGMKIR
ncbi:putative disease resistance protein RGA3 [Ipomoea triloba]|uniref:putative disease resistance protein RGA3 n=1 Tax=Ipomoea triloba TaxID=35885 RepID=UPI00125E9BAB|nr:putative disease resistance protein RGA3 [Ipomoea triloba]